MWSFFLTNIVVYDVSLKSMLVTKHSKTNFQNLKPEGHCTTHQSFSYKQS
uniref:Uncharacterized protein n=1 Tax=Arundo donax TaxID=35708 RepID=A0A0A8ZSL5_ARUDO